MKRGRELETLTMANYLMLLSRGDDYSPRGRVFECKTCTRKFPSFQALGGHRASHKKPRLGQDGSSSESSQRSSTKPKTHLCTVCGLEFAIGQALGGHMRRHRANSNNGTHLSSLRLSSSEVHAVLKKSNNGGERILCLDLNLTPLENDRKFDLQLGKTVSLYDSFL